MMERIVEPMLIDGFEQYRIYLDGRIESYSRHGKSKGPYTWRPLKQYTRLCNHKPYHIAVLRKPGERRTYTFYIHRLIWQHFKEPIPSECVIDHIDRNTLNNSLNNLRLASRSQNLSNQVCRSKIGYRGVYLARRSTAPNPYKASIRISRKTIHLGSFSTPIEAALAYNQAATQYFGEFAVLNDL